MSNYTVKERGNQSMMPNPDDDVIISRHRTLSGAERVVARADRAAKRQMGSTGYTTLYVHTEPVDEEQAARIAARVEYQGYTSLRVFDDGSWIAPATAAVLDTGAEFWNYTWNGKRYSPDSQPAL